MPAFKQVGSIKMHFRTLKDPRVRHRTDHRLIDIVVLALCGVIADCDNWPQIIDFARAHESWFKRFLKLPNGIPSQDTFERVFSRLDPVEFNRCCIAWLREASDLIGLNHVAIDGKTLCGSGSSKQRPLHLVSAWATEARLTLGEVAVDGKSNEINAIPELLQLLDLQGALVTIDAIGCQKKIAQQIINKGADYLLAVKENQRLLLEDVRNTVEQALEGSLPAAQVATAKTTSEGHGRKEERTHVVIRNVERIRGAKDWPGLRSVVMCLRERTVNSETTQEIHYFISSARLTARRAAEVLRGHWGIENQLHWHLDVTFGEDASRIQERNAARNFASMRKLALSALKRHPDKRSLTRKRKVASQDTEFLAEIITGTTHADKL